MTLTDLTYPLTSARRCPACGLESVMSGVFNGDPNTGDRPDAPNILVVLMIGGATLRQEDTVPQATVLHQNG